MTRVFRTACSAAALAGALGVFQAVEARVQYLYGLSDLSGPVPSPGGRVRVDRDRNETYFLAGNSVRVFNASGMETFSFVVDSGLGQPFDLAVEESGDILLATTNPDRAEGQASFAIRRCDYRGRPKAAIVPMLPDGLADFVPTAMSLRDGGFLQLMSPSQLRAVVLRTDGGFVRDVDLAPILMIDEDERGNLDIGGMAFDDAGTMVFTIPEHFHAVVVGPDWTRRTSFGQKGSGRGRFGIASGVAADRDGNFYIADKGRNVVLVFDKSFRFVTEFGGYGDRPESLVRPEQVAWSPNGRLYVTQKRNRGVSVFDVAAE